MASERRVKTQRRAVARLALELSFELSVLFRLENRSRGAQATEPVFRHMAEVYSAALVRAGRERPSDEPIS